MSAPLETAVREQHGFHRTKCGCDLCRAPCHHIPGSLDIDDLERLCPPGQNLFTWAEEHLRALTTKVFPTIVPARHPNGHCHWLFAGRCLVHDNAPYSCAFFDCHMPPDEVERRAAPTIAARTKDAANKGLYYQVWLHLCQRGLIGPPGDRAGLADELHRLRGAAAVGQ